MANYKHKKTGSTITSQTYHSLSSSERINWELDSSRDFINSALIGAVTDSALLGGIIGGSIGGGIVGDLLDGDIFD